MPQIPKKTTFSLSLREQHAQILQALLARRSAVAAAKRLLHQLAFALLQRDDALLHAPLAMRHEI